MDATALQAEIDLLLIRHGLLENNRKVGFACRVDGTDGLGDKAQPTSLAIRSLATELIRPQADWIQGTDIFRIDVDRGAHARPRLSTSTWLQMGIPFKFMPKGIIDKRGEKHTLALLDECIGNLSRELGQKLQNELLISDTLATRRALLEIYRGLGSGTIVRDRNEYRGGEYHNAEAISWLKAGVRAEIILYAFADPFNYSTRIRKSGPLFSLSDALELNEMPLRHIAFLYPLSDLEA